MVLAAGAARAPDGEPDWPDAEGRRVVFLLDASSRIERRLLESWIERHRPAARGPVDVVAIPPSRRRRRGPLDPALEAHLAAGDDPVLAPLRVAWLPERRDGVHAASLADLFTLGDPRDPGPLRQAHVLRRYPERCRIVAADTARASELRERWRRAGGADAGHTAGLGEFVVRQAALALERAERRVRGARYKVPRFVREEIVARPAFRGGVARLARQLGRPEEAVRGEAKRYLREIAATHSFHVIDLVANFIRWAYRQGYGALRYERSELERISALSQRHPVVFLPSHKSNLDTLVLKYAMYENDMPPPHTAGGINMNFFPIGPLLRRAGIFFIRRSFQDNAVYKFVLRQYIDYLIEKRFTLEWYIEGTRSRSGKLMPPRLGLLAYVVDAYRRRKSDDVVLVPVSIAYDQIQDVVSYAAEERGGRKEPESFGWAVRSLRALRRRYGNIYIRFGEPLSLARALGPPDRDAEQPQADEPGLDLQKLAFEVSARINRVTPITPTSLVTMALLGSGNRALSVDEVMARLGNLLRYVERRGLPTTVPLELDTEAGVQRALDALVENGVVSVFAGGPEAVYLIGPEKHLIAAYYRNTIIHFFVNGAIAELALLHAAETGAADGGPAFWDEAMRLRDLLKFEFFFAEKDAFREELRAEVALHDPEWEAHVARGPDEVRAVLRRFKPFSAHRVLRPFVEAYRVIADALARRDPAAPVDDEEILEYALALGKQYELQRRILSPESVSKALFSNALALARNRGLLRADQADLADRRRAFAAEVEDVIRRIDAVDALVAARNAGLLA